MYQERGRGLLDVVRGWGLAVAAALGLALLAGPAAADESVTPVRLSTRTVCVLPDFPVTGSGWKVQAAVREWNQAQHIIRLSTAPEPGCATVYVHRYTGPSLCGFTTWDRTWTLGRWAPAMDAWVVDGADIYLNDGCHPRTSHWFSKRTVAHEIGHALGLPHSTSSRSVMYASDGQGPTIGHGDSAVRRALIAPVDVRAICALYRDAD